MIKTLSGDFGEESMCLVGKFLFEFMLLMSKREAFGAGTFPGSKVVVEFIYVAFRDL